MHHPLFVNQRSNLMEDGAVNIYLIFFFLIKVDVWSVSGQFMRTLTNLMSPEVNDHISFW
jgi:hypothetical protein